MNDERSEVLISIIIATFNAAKHLEACLQSITSQNFKHIEIIIVDGASSDSTVSILKQNECKNLFWISEKDDGIYDALNKGVKMARGKWLHFLGSDDRLLAGFSELALKLKNERTVYYGKSEEYYLEETKPPYIILKGKFSKYRLAKFCLNHQAILYPASVFKKYKYSLRYKVFADYELNIKVWGDNHFKKKYYPLSIVEYNMNGMSSVVNDTLFKEEKIELIKKYMSWFIYLRFLFRNYKRKLSEQKEPA